MPRSVKEWVGKNDDAMPPQSVRLRIFERHGGKCHLTGLKITIKDEWHLDHIKELWEGGENRESNLAPALVEPHKGKSAEGRKRKAKADRIKAKHIGADRKKGRPMPGSKRSRFRKKMDGTVKRRT